jgi:geranylgeranyl pyrophosphate synthase
VDELFADASALLRQDLLRFLEAHGFSTASPLGADMLVLLSAAGKLLSINATSSRIPQGFWALLPFEVARYCRPGADSTLVLRMAVSCEMLLCALDYFDELQDGDQSPERRVLGDSRLLNAAYTLSVLAHRAILTLPPPLIVPIQRDRLLDAMEEGLLAAVQGQHQDLLAEERPFERVSPEECLAIDTAKAGALLRLACRLATLAVETPAEISESFAQIGELVGTAFQIENDAHDLEMLLSASGESGKSDLARSKKTLPTVFAARQYHALQQSPPPADDEKQEPQQDMTLLHRAYADGIAASLGCAVHLRRQAQTLARGIEERQGRPLPRAIHVLLGIETL